MDLLAHVADVSLVGGRLKLIKSIKIVGGGESTVGEEGAESSVGSIVLGKLESSVFGVGLFGDLVLLGLCGQDDVADSVPDA